jgi:hypothetical protein
MKKGLCFILMLFIAAAAFSVDFGLVLGAESEYADNFNPEGFSFTGNLSPWFSAVPSEKINFHASGKLSFEYDENGEPPESYFFEMERTELIIHPVSAAYLSFGRRHFEDAAGLVASGLFDGAEGSVKLGMSRLSLGAFYTGLLYKETAKIIMTAGDFERYQKPLDAPNLEGYFASRRILLALTGEFPDLTSRISLTVQGLAQFDLNDAPVLLNTQYLGLRFAAEPVDFLHVHAGGVGELAQEAEELQGSAAVFAGADWEVSGALVDLLSAEFLWTGGRADNNVCAFAPVSGRNAGRVFDAGLGALMSAGLSYRIRPTDSFSLEAGGAYFIRTDLETLGDGDLDEESKSRLLGGELYGSLVWGPDPALRLNAGGGAFFPGWGGAFQEGAAVRWKVNFGVIVSL